MGQCRPANSGDSGLAGEIPGSQGLVSRGMLSRLAVMPRTSVAIPKPREEHTEDRADTLRMAEGLERA